MQEVDRTAHGPLGKIHGMEWDPVTGRYFRCRSGEIEGRGGEDSLNSTPQSSAVSVGLTPVDRAVVTSLRQQVCRWNSSEPQRTRRRRTQGPYSTVDAECAVCLTTFARGDRLVEVPLCRHVFHKACLEPWLEQRGSCPRCRQPVDAALFAAEKSAQATHLP
mmetsp:Transcript_42351/g.95313  ORF Transcript_42351/g.95313 Transcript_42351/m.95313 type:complete len:162 (-) Transcript_42351:14-499(-)